MDHRSRVVRLAGGGRRERRELDRLLDEALVEILAAKAGDLTAVYGAHRAVNNAVGLMLRHRWDAA